MSAHEISTVNEAAAPEPLTAVGHSVRVAPVVRRDLEPYRRALQRSRARLARWNPVEPTDLERHLRFQSRGHRTFIIHALAPEGDHDIVGRVNVSGVVWGRASAAQLGYDAYDPYVGRGLFAEGLRLVVNIAFAGEPYGVGLHRLEAAVQPGNVESAGLLRSLGFRRRGQWPGYLWLPDATGGEAWRDHVTYGIIAPEWPAAPYDLVPPDRPVVLVPPAARGLGRRLAVELAAPLLDQTWVRTMGQAEFVGLLSDCPGAVIVAGDQWPAHEVLRAAGYDPSCVVDARDLDAEPDDVRGAACAIALIARDRAHRSR